MTDKIPLLTPGQILKEEFLIPLEITPYKLAKGIGVQQTRISDIINKARRITPDTGLRLSRFFGTSEKFWINLQVDYDLRLAKDKNSDVLDKIERFQDAS